MPNLILLIVLLLGFVGVILVFRRQSSDPPGRKLWRNDRGALIAIGARQQTAPGHLSGHGSQTSAPLQLSAGTYRLDYQFDALTRLALIDANGDDTLLIKSGAGTEALNIAETGRYRLRIEPADERAEWQIVYRQII